MATFQIDKEFLLSFQYQFPSSSYRTSSVNYWISTIKYIGLLLTFYITQDLDISVLCYMYSQIKDLYPAQWFSIYSCILHSGSVYMPVSCTVVQYIFLYPAQWFSIYSCIPAQWFSIYSCILHSGSVYIPVSFTMVQFILLEPAQWFSKNSQTRKVTALTGKALSDIANHPVPVRYSTHHQFNLDLLNNQITIQVWLIREKMLFTPDELTVPWNCKALIMIAIGKTLLESVIP